ELRDRARLGEQRGEVELLEERYGKVKDVPVDELAAAMLVCVEELRSEARLREQRVQARVGRQDLDRRIGHRREPPAANRGPGAGGAKMISPSRSSVPSGSRASTKTRWKCSTRR